MNLLYNQKILRGKLKWKIVRFTFTTFVLSVCTCPHYILELICTSAYSDAISIPYIPVCLPFLFNSSPLHTHKTRNARMLEFPIPNRDETLIGSKSEPMGSSTRNVLPHGPLKRSIYG